MDKNFFKNNRRQIFITLAVIWGLAALGVIIFLITTIGKVHISVEYAPYAAKVQLNGVQVNNHSQNYITPGEYQLVVSYENFDTYEATITIDEDTEFIYGTLIASNDEGRKYIEEHLAEFSAINKYASAEANKIGEKLREKYPIIDSLPIKEPYYTIGYNYADESGVLNITVESGIAYRQLAARKVLEILSPEDFAKYDITFYDLNSPFTGKFSDNDSTDPTEYIKNGFKNAGVDFEVRGGHEEGDYYYAYLRYYYDKTINVIYRVVLTKNSGTWQLVADPKPLLTTFNTPNTPLEIINQANSL